jgi:FixJ family two-component response regulator
MGSGSSLPAGPLIAVVDDDAAVGDALEGYLVALGFSVDVHLRAEDFLRSRRLEETACLIADISMPGMSGFDLMERLITLGHAIPVIIVTANVNAGTRARAASAGAVCYLPKPVAIRQLMSCIQAALDRHKPKTQ